MWEKYSSRSHFHETFWYHVSTRVTNVGPSSTCTQEHTLTPKTHKRTKYLSFLVSFTPGLFCAFHFVKETMMMWIKYWKQLYVVKRVSFLLGLPALKCRSICFASSQHWLINKALL